MLPVIDDCCFDEPPCVQMSALLAHGCGSPSDMRAFPALAWGCGWAAVGAQQIEGDLECLLFPI